MKIHYYKNLFAEEIDSDCKLESTYKLDNRCYYFFFIIPNFSFVERESNVYICLNIIYIHLLK